MTRRGWGVGAVVGAAVLLVTACGGDPEPVVSPSATPSVTVSPSVSPSPSPSPSATALTEDEVLAAIPEAARVESFPGAVAFADYFMRLSSEVYVSSDTRQFEAVSELGCTFCASTVEAVEAMVVDGLVAQGGSLTSNQGAATGGLQSDDTWLVTFDVEVEERAFVDAAGVSDGSVPGESARVTVALRYSGEMWRVIDVGAEASP